MIEAAAKGGRRRRPFPSRRTPFAAAGTTGIVCCNEIFQDKNKGSPSGGIPFGRTEDRTWMLSLSFTSTFQKTRLDDLLCHQKEFWDAPGYLGFRDLLLALQGETEGQIGFKLDHSNWCSFSNYKRNPLERMIELHRPVLRKTKSATKSSTLKWFALSQGACIKCYCKYTQVFH